MSDLGALRERVAEALAGEGQTPTEYEYADADVALTAVSAHINDWDIKRRAAEAFSMSDDPNRPPFYSTRAAMDCLDKALVALGLLPVPQGEEQ